MQDDWETFKFIFREESQRIENSISELRIVNREKANRDWNPPETYDNGLYEVARDLRDDYIYAVGKIDHAMTSVTRTDLIIDSAKSASIMRFREKLSQLKNDWTSLWENVEHEKRKLELFSGSRPSRNSNSEASTLLHERGSITQSIGTLDNAIDTAASANDMLRRQNDSLYAITGKLGGVTSKIPFISGLLGRINNRHFQERLILGLVASVCISILIWMRILR